MSSKDKKPKTEVTPRGRSPRITSNPGDTGKETPVWSLCIFDEEGPLGRKTCDQNEVIWYVILKLKQYESMSWNEILQNKKYNHSVSIKGIIKEAKNRLDDMKLDDVDDLFRFRLSGTTRVWGIRDGRVFKILWFDPDHEISPVDKD